MTHHRSRVHRLLPAGLLLASLSPLVSVIDTAQQPTTKPMAATRSPAELFKILEGQWQGSSKTWLRGKLFDDAPIKGRIQAIPGGLFLQHNYTGSMQGKERTGQETLAFDTVAGQFQSAWLDTFHMSTGLMFSAGPATKDGFAVTGSYAVGSGQKPWGWRTEWVMRSDDHVVITMFNISPDGREEKGVETDYRRVAADKPR